MSREEINNEILKILQKYGAKKIAVFGSYARGENRKDSDIDILVELPDGISLFDFVGMKQELEEKLNKKIDLVTYNSISPLLKDIILSEQKVLYEQVS